MAKFLIGIDIEQIRSTVIVVEVEADSLAEAERKAETGANAACLRARKAQDLGIGQYHEWGGEGFGCLGVNRDENWNSGDWSVDLKV